MIKVHWKRLLIVLAVAMVCRIAYAFLVWHGTFVSPDETMSKMYVRSAYMVAAGIGYYQVYPPASPGRRDVLRLVEEARQGKVITPETAGDISREGLYPELLHPPGWSVVAAGLHRVFRQPVWLVMQALTIGVDVAACGLLYWLVLLCLGNQRVAVVASVIYAVFPTLCYATVNLRPLGFMSFFMILATICAVLAGKSAGGKKWVYYVACGVVLGLSVYFRPDFLLLGPFFILGFWLCERRFWMPVVAGVAILVVSLAVLFPWAHRNHQVCGRWIFTSCGAGCTLVTGLGTYPNPWGFGPSDIDRGREARAQGLKTPFCPEADLYFRKVFAEAVKEHPLAYAKIVAKRIPQAVATPYSWGLKRKGKISFTELRTGGKILEKLPYIVRTFGARLSMAVLSFISLICSIAMFLRERKRHVLIVFPLLVPGYAALSHLFTHMAPYYLLPGVFGFLIGLAYVLSRGWRGQTC